MKKIIFVVLICYVFISCVEHPYIEGCVETKEVINITDHSATCKGNVIIEKGKEDAGVRSKGIIFGSEIARLDYSPSYTNNMIISDKKNEGAFECHMMDLQSNTKFYVRVFAIIGYEKNDNVSDTSRNKYKKQEIVYGSVKEFTTKSQY
ncbi:hypothetical protein AGMMS4956_03990 [Bacteroidia bacterium]|nr:hypothetical protein AGMMS4956_03990 [Bacteroidia bacterium]